MSLQHLQVPFADVRGDSLRWARGLPERPALARRALRMPDGRGVDLRILGASHQVVVRGAGLFESETVVSDLDAAEPLPADLALADYRFTSSVERLAPDDFSQTVRRLLAALDGREDAVAASFPGAAYAVTALALDPSLVGGLLGWQTWHAYPQTGELVHTRTVLESGIDLEDHR